MQIYVRNLIGFFCDQYNFVYSNCLTSWNCICGPHRYYSWILPFRPTTWICRHSCSIYSDSSFRVTNTINVTLSVAGISGLWRMERRPRWKRGLRCQLRLRRRTQVWRLACFVCSTNRYETHNKIFVRGKCGLHVGLCWEQSRINLLDVLIIIIQ